MTFDGSREGVDNINLPQAQGDTPLFFHVWFSVEWLLGYLLLCPFNSLTKLVVLNMLD